MWKAQSHLIYQLVDGAAIVLCAAIVLATADSILKHFGVSFFAKKKRQAN